MGPSEIGENLRMLKESVDSNSDAIAELRQLLSNTAQESIGVAMPILIATIGALATVGTVYLKNRAEVRLNNFQRAAEGLGDTVAKMQAYYKAIQRLIEIRNEEDNNEDFARQLIVVERKHGDFSSSGLFIPPHLDLMLTRAAIVFANAVKAATQKARLTSSECMPIIVPVLAEMLAFNDAAVRWKRAHWKRAMASEPRLELACPLDSPAPIEAEWLVRANDSIERILVVAEPPRKR